MYWLNSLTATLDSQPEPAVFFFRDDDAGWEDERLFALLDLFGKHDVPIDVAVIPRSISIATAGRLRGIVEQDREFVSVHQHGYAHVNHEATGRKCEFGSTRTRELQLADINHGRQLLRDLFGESPDAMFTPPWNRCTTVTTDCLRAAGFEVLSRDVTATPLDAQGLTELPVAVDWFAHRKGVRFTVRDLGHALGTAASSKTSIGVMLHHALMDEEERTRLGELLNVLASHSQAACVLMRDLTRNSGAVS